MLSSAADAMQTKQREILTRTCVLWAKNLKFI